MLNQDQRAAAPRSLTLAQRKRLAEEARKLAMECVDGTAPEFEVDSYCGCAVGIVMQRALAVHVPDIMRTDADYDKYHLAVRIDEYLPDRDTLGVVSRALQSELGDRAAQQNAVVFPLLALADALEES